MNTVDRQLALRALRLTGEELNRHRPDFPTVRIMLVGGVAGMVTGQLDPSRTTTDCDVVASEPVDLWNEVADAAGRAAEKLALNANWLNIDSQMYLYRLPLGWRERCEIVGRFGPLEVLAVSRRDLICMKIVSAPQRPQDREDVARLRPTEEELDFAEENLDRLESESLDREEFNICREYVAQLRMKHGQ